MNSAPAHGIDRRKAIAYANALTGNVARATESERAVKMFRSRLIAQYLAEFTLLKDAMSQNVPSAHGLHRGSQNSLSSPFSFVPQEENSYTTLMLTAIPPLSTLEAHSSYCSFSCDPHVGVLNAPEGLRRMTDSEYTALQNRTKGISQGKSSKNAPESKRWGHTHCIGE